MSRRLHLMSSMMNVSHANALRDRIWWLTCSKRDCIVCSRDCCNKQASNEGQRGVSARQCRSGLGKSGHETATTMVDTTMPLQEQPQQIG